MPMIIVKSRNAILDKMKQAFLLPLLLCATLASAQSSPPDAGSSVLRALSAGRIERIDIYEKSDDWKTDFDDVIRSFELPEACSAFMLTEEEVRDFFQKARPLSKMERKSIEYSSLSRCVVEGDMKLRGEGAVHWTIDRARNATVRLSNRSGASSDQTFSFYCDQCTNGKFYSPTGQKLSDWRPVIENIFIDDNASWPEGSSAMEPSPSPCAGFTLAEGDVQEFFSTARASSRLEYQHDAGVSRCYANGRATLRDGKTARWRIDQGRRGEIWFFSDNPETLPSILYFYCARCPNKKYFEACDVDCMIAKAKEKQKTASKKGNLPVVERILFSGKETSN